MTKVEEPFVPNYQYDEPFSRIEELHCPLDCEKLITGTGRHGSHFVAKILNEGGCNNVCHDHHLSKLFTKARRNGKDLPYFPIQISWMGVANWDRPNDCLHFVREPLVCIRSMGTTSVQNRYFTEYQLWTRLGVDVREKPIIYRCMFRYHEWNKWCEELSRQTIRTENIEDHVDDLAEFCDGDKIMIAGSIAKQSKKNVNHRKPKLKVLTWKDLFDTDEELAQKIQEQTKQYGYAV